MSPPAQFDVVIVGAGHAGAQTAVALRQLKYRGSVAVLGDEVGSPYERPPLSKDYLAGKTSFDRILLRPASFWSANGIDHLQGTEVVDLDPVARTVTTADGWRIGYGQLVWAAGGRARRLDCDGHGLAGVHTIRTRVDVDRLSLELPSAKHVVVIGGGYVGLEVTATLVAAGKHITVLETQERVLARVTGPTVARHFQDEHRARGVELRHSATVERLDGYLGRVTAVGLASGETLPADLVVVGIGITPSIAPVQAAGAATSDGLHTDPGCATTLPAVYAVGDCAAQINPFADGARIRIESVQNANEQARTVAARILGDADAEYKRVPWFWSNQYDLRLQTVGLSSGFDEEIIRGVPATGRFSVIYRRKGAVIALDCVNSTRDYVEGRLLVERGAQCDAGALAEPVVSLKALAAALW